MLTRRDFLGGSAGLAAAVAAGCASGRRPDFDPGAPRPNILVIQVDDLGFELLGCYGGQTHKTPHCDRLAAGGMRFKYCFATPACSPSRVQLLTGRYNFRSGFIDITGRNGAPSMLDPRKEITLANLLRDAGYDTAVCCKWHLGWGSTPTTGPAEFDPRNYRPSSNIKACGFKEQYCFSGPHITYGPPYTTQYHPDVYHNWAMKYLESRKGKDRPFFLWYALGLVHFDYDPTPLNPTGKKNDKANFPWMMQYMDMLVGQTVRKLEELGLRDNTLIILTGDGGTDRHKTMWNGRELEGGKGTMKDTGAWSPLIVSWPGRIKPGSYCDELTDLTDILPTCCEVAGARVPTDRVIDGVSLVKPLLGQPGRNKPYVHVQLVKKRFVRDSRWKMREDGRLYDCKDTPFDEKLIEAEKDTPESKEARQRLAAWLAKLA
jgi:arylsulfatase A-like enzyme